MEDGFTNEKGETIMIRLTLGRCGFAFAILVVALFAAAPLGAAEDNSYTVTPLVSDQPGVAPVLDPDLVNAWGLTASSTSPWWVADNGTSKSTLYNGITGAKVPLTVTVGVDSGPTGVVFNGGASFLVTNGSTSAPARFIFDGEDGLIRGWNPSVDPTHAVVTPATGDPGAIYKGLAIADGMLYANDFHNGVVDVFDGSWSLVNQFTDAGLPSGYAPFGIQAIGGRIFVTFAKQDADAHDEVAGQGRGFVDVFDTAGTLLARVAQHGLLNAPWGLALAPADFGRFGGDLLVGNFGDGRINAFEPESNGHFAFRGQLGNGSGPITIDGLWALGFGNGAAAGPKSTLFFTAGPAEEAHGLFGSIKAG
jgi:uncharacterized protein (TIGR03118 family)